MNFLYIDCIIRERQEEVREKCEKNRLLNWNRWMDPCHQAGTDSHSSSSDVRSRILETASRFFQDKGYDNTKVLDVCHSLGISRLQFHRHFRSLDHVLETLWAR